MALPNLRDCERGLIPITQLMSCVEEIAALPPGRSKDFKACVMAVMHRLGVRGWQVDVDEVATSVIEALEEARKSKVDQVKWQHFVQRITMKVARDLVNERRLNPDEIDEYIIPSVHLAVCDDCRVNLLEAIHAYGKEQTQLFDKLMTASNGLNDIRSDIEHVVMHRPIKKGCIQYTRP